MVLAGFADVVAPFEMARERPYGEENHIVWSVPPQAAAGLVDSPRDWSGLDEHPSDE